MLNKMASCIKTLKRIRSVIMFWLPERSLDHLAAIREQELLDVLDLLPPEGALLEIGAGTGWQARWLADKRYNVSAIDLASSNYREDRVWPVTEYDGQHIPFEDGTFNIVFSSNVLEHIPHIQEFQKEIHRVLKPGGRVIHILPSSNWSFWTNITHPIRYWSIPKAHGVHAANCVTEICHFRRQRWVQLFQKTGWTVESIRSIHLFYTGSSLFDDRLSTNARRTLSRLLGGVSNVFVLQDNSRGA